MIIPYFSATFPVTLHHLFLPTTLLQMTLSSTFRRQLIPMEEAAFSAQSSTSEQLSVTPSLLNVFDANKCSCQCWDRNIREAGEEFKIRVDECSLMNEERNGYWGPWNVVKMRKNPNQCDSHVVHLSQRLAINFPQYIANYLRKKKKFLK